MIGASRWSRFGHPRGAEIMVDGATHKRIRRRETYEDLVAAEMV